jgi:propanol-preferring alcohol dehydrogenase
MSLVPDGSGEPLRVVLATGAGQHGGYAEYMTVAEDFAYAIPISLTSSGRSSPVAGASAIGPPHGGMEDGQAWV